MEQRPSCAANSDVCSRAIPCIPWNLHVHHRVHSSLAAYTIQPNVFQHTRYSRTCSNIHDTAERVETHTIQPNVFQHTRYSRTCWNIHNTGERVETYTIQANVFQYTRYSRTLSNIHYTAERVPTYTIQPNVLKHTRYSRTCSNIHDTAERVPTYTIQSNVSQHTRYSRTFCYLHDTAERLATYTIQPNVSPHPVSFSNINTWRRSKAAAVRTVCRSLFHRCSLWCPRISLRPIKDRLCTSAAQWLTRHTSCLLPYTQHYLDLSSHLTLSYTL